MFWNFCNTTDNNDIEMKLSKFLVLPVCICVAAGISAQAAETTKLLARAGSKLRIEGTSNIHDWQVESALIGGSLDVAGNFPTEPGQNVAPGKVDAKGEVFITVRSLKSLQKDGKPYSDAMDGIMHGKLDTGSSPRITFKLTELTLKEAAKSKDAPYIFDSKGQVTVAGVTKDIEMTVNVLPLGEKKVKISGSVPLKMTDFKIEPPAPAVGGGLIKTGDAVKVLFDWNVAPRSSK